MMGKEIQLSWSLYGHYFGVVILNLFGSSSFFASYDWRETKKKWAVWETGTRYRFISSTTTRLFEQGPLKLSLRQGLDVDDLAYLMECGDHVVLISPGSWLYWVIIAWIYIYW